MTEQTFERFKKAYETMMLTWPNWEEYFQKTYTVQIDGVTYGMGTYIEMLAGFKSFQDIPSYFVDYDTALSKFEQGNKTLRDIVDLMENGVAEIKREDAQKRKDILDFAESQEDNEVDGVDATSMESVKAVDGGFFSRMHKELADAKATWWNSKEYEKLVDKLKEVKNYLNSGEAFDEKRYNELLDQLDQSADAYMKHKLEDTMKDNSIKKVNIAVYVKDYIRERKQDVSKPMIQSEERGELEKELEQELAKPDVAKAKANMALSHFAKELKPDHGLKVDLQDVYIHYLHEASAAFSSSCRKEDRELMENAQKRCDANIAEKRYLSLEIPIKRELSAIIKSINRAVVDKDGQRTQWKLSLEELKEAFATYIALRPIKSSLDKMMHMPYDEEKFNDLSVLARSRYNPKVLETIMKTDEFKEITSSEDFADKIREVGVEKFFKKYMDKLNDVEDKEIEDKRDLDKSKDLENTKNEFNMSLNN